jgi:glutamine synthetase
MSIESARALIKESEAKFVDLRFTDTKGKEQHVSIPAHQVNDDFFEEGKMFDGSSIAGWKGINESDMILMPDASTAVVDPFAEETQVNIRCDILEPTTMQGYSRDPRSVASRAEEYLKSTGIGDTVLFGPEPEFFLFDDVKFHTDMAGSFYAIDAEEAKWNSGADYDGGNMGHRPGVKGGYFPVPPVDSAHDIRAARCMVKKADEIQIYKYVIHNVAHAYGKTATFMPKPLVGDNGSGMHCHQSISKDGKNIFAGDKYAGMSEEALYYIGGIIKHARAINAFANASTNSYKRLVPGFEAPVMLAYSARNRSASIRIPYVTSDRARRIEVRFPDPTANPYLAFTAMLMAGIDGIKNKIHPGDSMDKDLYDLPAEEAALIPQVASSLEQALAALDEDRAFLTAGGVMSDEMIDAYIDLKSEEVQAVNMTTHPLEFDMYYSC